jgi:hypothetical protein
LTFVVDFIVEFKSSAGASITLVPFFKPLAKQDIMDAASWYYSKQKGLGKKFT